MLYIAVLFFMSFDQSYIIEAQLLSLLVYLLDAAACFALAFMLIKWKNIKLRYILMAATVVLGVVAVVSNVYIFIWNQEQADKFLKSFRNDVVIKEPASPTPINTYYIERLKKLTPDSIKAQAPEDFYTYYGHNGAWRFPLVYPFDVRASDIDYNCWLSYEDPDNVSSQVMPGVVEFNFDKIFFIAKTETNDAAIKYNVYNFWTGKVVEYTTLDECFNNAVAWAIKENPS